jgi:hypothetical protein
VGDPQLAVGRQVVGGEAFTVEAVPPPGGALEGAPLIHIGYAPQGGVNGPAWYVEDADLRYLGYDGRSRRVPPRPRPEVRDQRWTLPCT